MLQLSNGSRLGKVSVHPKNWDKPGADITIDWYISYRIYSGNTSRQKKVQGMNGFHTLKDRRQATQIILEEIQSVFHEPQESEYRSMLFIPALREALKRRSYVHKARVDVNSILNSMERSCMQLGFHRLMISEISRKHVKLALEHQFKVNPNFTPARFNKCKAYLSALFKELIELEAIDTNPARDISNMRVTKKLRKVVSKADRQRIDEKLRVTDYYFWRFTNIFFHSGGRVTELFLLKKEQVDIVEQKYTCMIRKGGQCRETERTIKDIALPLWEEVMKECGAGQYLFSKFLKPGNKVIRPDQVTRRWNKLVKKELGIVADFYSLKHANTSEVVDLLDNAAAARMNGHTTTKMVDSVYDVNRAGRKHQQLKGLGNSFA